MKTGALLTIIAGLALGCVQQPADIVADTVYTNGKIYTVNEAQALEPSF